MNFAFKNKRLYQFLTLGFYSLLFVLLMSQWAQAAMRLPSANRECATCHVMWLTEFKREDVDTLIPYDPKPVEKTGKQDAASTDAMCFSCHDGFVLESRFLWEDNKHAHPVGVKPSKNISIPIIDGKNLLPLNDDGKVYCGTCHTAHGVEWGQKDTAIFMRVRNEQGQLCMACHKDKIKGPKHGSHPLKRKIQKLLKQPPKILMAAGAQFAEDGEVLCQSCHKPHAAPEEKLLLVKNDKSQLCGHCHSDRYAMTMKQAGSMGTHPVNVVSNQLEVPKELIKAGAKLGGKGEVICQTCHRPHDATPETSLLVTENRQGSLCQSCHLSKRSVQDSKHDMTKVRKDSQNMAKQTVAETGACGACHLPHKGSGPKMWARNINKDEEPMAALCLSCHSKEGIAKKHSVGKYSHPVGIDINRLGHTVKLPAYDKDGRKTVGKTQGKVSCASCHDPHQWNPLDADDKGEIEQPGNSRTRFLRVANGSDAALCKSCHDDKWEVAGSKHDMRFMAPKSENSLGQSVEKSGICGTCHLVHHANGPKLWARSDLQGQGTGYIACTGCHNKNGLAKQKDIALSHTHPMDVPIDKLAIEVTSNGWLSRLLKGQSMFDKPGNLLSLPLYDRRGKSTQKDGRVGCGTCHDPHKWSPLDYTKPEHPKNLEGDTDSSFLRIADQGKSRLCLNCHVEKQSILLTKHDLTDEPLDYISRPPKNKIDNVNQGAVRGVCMHCHAPHNAKGPALWGRSQGDGEAPIARLCADCHQKGAIAAGKLPSDHSHPVGVSTAKVTDDSRIPVFDEAGKRTGHGGNVDCASCHDPHQWNPVNPQLKSLPLLEEEGHTANSFLRLPANKQSDLCVSCHADKKTIRGTDHDLSVTAPSAKNDLQQARDVSGLCGQCHVPHNVTDEAYLWARPLGKGADPVEQRCRSCHQQGQLAAAKNPTIARHSGSINIWSPELRKQIKQQEVADMPAFDEQGKRAVFGKITCATCHNPHQWNALHQKAGPGKNMEGDAESSFLRTNDTSGIVCADCHGKDGLFRYKYFHGESSHKKHHMFR